MQYVCTFYISLRFRCIFFQQIVEILLTNPKNSQLLYKPNKLQETPYNIDMSYNKTILGQIFGAREYLISFFLNIYSGCKKIFLLTCISLTQYSKWAEGK